MKYLITGATGDVASRIVKQLLERDIRPRVLVRDQAKATSLFGDRAEVVTGDLAEPEDLRRAFEGVETVYLVNVGPQIPQRDEMSAMVAKQKKVKRIDLTALLAASAVKSRILRGITHNLYRLLSEATWS
jgi:uncharacterized protein YbjT (DUF2867 family)